MPEWGRWRRLRGLSGLARAVGVSRPVGHACQFDRIQCTTGLAISRLGSKCLSDFRALLGQTP
jgi:hypothetical protein